MAGKAKNTMEISHTTHTTLSSDTHTFTYNKKKTYEKSQENHGDIDDESFVKVGEYENAPFTGHKYKYQGVGRTWIVTTLYIKCPICDEECEVREVGRKFKETYIAEDSRMF